MPLPKRGEKETREQFMSRCMSDETVQKDFPNQDQRVAVCMSNAGFNAKSMDTVDFAYNYETFGFTEDLNEDNFYTPLECEYVDLGEQTQEWDISKENASLWENIRKKKEREGKNYKPAQPGDKDRPTKQAWKQAKSDSGDEMAIEQLQKMHDQLMGIVSKIKMMDIKFQDWTKDMISKAEIYVQNVYDFVSYYEPGKYEDEYVEEPSELEDENEDEDMEDDSTYASEYQGRKVTLNKPFRTPKGPKKFSVYVKNDKGNVVKVNFGDPNMEIKRDIPARRKSFRARHQCDTNPGPKWKARYWSCKMW
jgi:hypothetical protein